MSRLDTGQLIFTAVDIYNALSKSHAKTVDGLSITQAASVVNVAGYVALRAMLTKFEVQIRAAIAPESWESLETIIQVMARDAAAPRVPTAQA